MPVRFGLFVARLGILAAAWAFGSEIAGAGSASIAAAEGTLAWIRFDKADERYLEVPYYWLGRVEVSVTLDVRPEPDHVLEVHWGAKNDTRDAVVEINGRQVRLSHGGYDGFEWLAIPLPERLDGDRYQIAFRPGAGKPAFLAEIRLRTKDAEAPTDAETADQPAYRGNFAVGPIAPAEAFPEMRALWDREPEPRSTTTADAKTEAIFRQAERNARRAAEQFFRCRKFVDGWLKQADPTTGLIPRNLTNSRDIWNAKDAAADNYPYMVLTAAITDRGLFEGRMLEMLQTETRLTSRIGAIPDTWSFSRQAFQDSQPNLDEIIFGGSEYIKDGLLPLTEWLGSSPWSERMIAIADDIWKHAPVETPWGKIPTLNVEVNGDLLQAMSRLYWMTGNRKYLEYGERLADYYLLGDNHPTRNFDSLRLRDHGCEIVSGLSELYATVHFAHPEKKQVYQEPMHAVLDRILEVGRNEHGMLYNVFNPKTGEHDPGICDTWGYNYNAVYTVFLVDQRQEYRQAVRDVLGNLHEHLTNYHWGSADEYADSIEGAINLYNREPVASAADWVDSEIADMWRVQQPDGIVEGWHGDGNSARTAIMYALWKTQGLTVRPWRADVRVGAVQSDGRLYVSLLADEPWSGRLLFDRPRHRVAMHFPIDYPRINQFPEWFTAEAGRSFEVLRPGDDEAAVHDGEKLVAGLNVDLKPGQEIRLVITPRPAGSAR